MAERSNSPSKSSFSKNQNEILSEIKQVWELMEEEKENDSNCVDNSSSFLKEHEHKFELLDNHLINLKTSLTKSSAVLETNNDFQEDVKGCNKMFMKSIKQIYTDCQQHNVNIIAYENEHEQLEKLFEENERKSSLAKKKFEMEEKELLAKLDKVKMEQTELNDKMKSFHENNHELQNELDLLEKTIEQKGKYAKMMFLFNAEVDKHLELLKQADDDLAAAATAMHNFQVEQQASEQPYLFDTQQFEQRNQDVYREISAKRLEEQKKDLEELCKIKKDLKDSMLLNTALLETYKTSLINMRNKGNITSGDCTNKVEDIKKWIDEYEALYVSQTQVIKITDQDFNSLRDKIEELLNEVDVLYLYIKDIQDIPEVKTILLDEKKVELEQLKTSRKLMKDEYTNATLALQTESTGLQNQVKECQTDLNQLQQDYEHMEREVAQLVSKRDMLTSEKNTHEIELADLEEKLISMTTILDNLKAEMPQKFNKPNGVAKRQVIPKVKLPKFQWESDSSIEGVDHTISMRNKVKLQRRKASN